MAALFFMLVLSRKLGEAIVIDGRIKVTVIRMDANAVKLGIAAPPEVPIHREEIFEAMKKAPVAPVMATQSSQ